MALIGKKTGSVPSGPGPLMATLNPLSDPRMRDLVRSAVTGGDYVAVQEAFALAKRGVPANTELWSWWLDGIENLARSGDQDAALFARFTRDVDGISPWGKLPAAARDRLRALG